MTGKIILSMNVDGPPTPELVRQAIDTLAHYRDYVEVSHVASDRGWILDSNGINVRGTWRYEND